nr:MAG TPA: repressor [Caudoviricetes sp.]
MKDNENISKKITWDEKRNFRFNKYFEYLGITQDEFALKIGYPQSNINAILNNKRALGEKIINTYIIPNCPELNTEWLRTGEGEMLKSEGEPEIIKEEKGKIPYYDVDFAGGWSTEELFTNAMPAYYISAPEFAKSEFACNLRGNSISNRIRSGAIIGLKEIFNWEIYFPTNELYAVITKNDLRTVKIVKWGKNKKYLELIPDPLPEFNNPPYESETIPVDFVTKMFQVVAWGYYERLVV